MVPLFLTLALDGGERLASSPDCFTPGLRATSIHWIGSWMGPRACLDDMKEINNLLLLEIELSLCSP
jgi:hypothetical protein